MPRKPAARAFSLPHGATLDPLGPGAPILPWEGRFPDEGHGIRKLGNRVIAYRRIAAFLERTLGVGSSGG